MVEQAMEIPNHFTDEELIEIIDSSPFILSLSTKGHCYDLNCGLILLCRTGLHRLSKRSKFRRKVISDMNKDEEDYDSKYARLLYKLVTFYSKSIDTEIWTIENIFIAGEELHLKTKPLSSKLQKLLYKQPLILIDTNIISSSDEFKSRKEKHQILYFHEDFLGIVAKYHDSLRRQEGTFDMESNDKLDFLSKFDRDICKQCNQRRAVYCGECKGLRMENTSHLLPKRISLPFDVLIVKHFAESYKTCTGVHSAVIGMEGQTEFAYWPRGLYNKGQTGKDISELVASFDPDRDVILYPSADAIDSNVFPWQSKTEEFSKRPSENLNRIHRWRLIVLEASWHHGKTMAQQIVDYRADHNPPLPPLKYVSLSSLHGQYWKFHELGDTAVSTMEAIAHAAKCAWHYIGDEEQEISNKYEDLLFLFKLQKYRVLNRVSNNDGNLPRSIFVDGGVNVWGSLTCNL